MNRRTFLKNSAQMATVTAMAGSMNAFGRGLAEKPNILVFMADDWGYPHSPLYGDKAITTSGFSRIANDGVLFTHGFCNSPSCSPSRAALLTGQDVFRLGMGSCLDGPLATDVPVYPDLLEAAGYAVGFCVKGWGPGDWSATGRTRNPAGPNVPDFKGFVRDLPADKPFCYWYGTTDPHRPYTEGSGIKNGIDPSAITVPPFLPDSPEVRSDLADYLYEVKRFNDEVMGVITFLEETGRYDDTIIIMTGDNGMPFPRCKINLYNWGVHQPLAISWKSRIPSGRVIDDYVSFKDFAPTILEAAGLPIPSVMTGRSLLPMLLSNKSGKIESDRDAVVTARERHGSNIFPMRSIRTNEYAYIRNKLTDISIGLGDSGPTTEYMEAHKTDNAVKNIYALTAAFRPAEELYDLKTDPYEIKNVADDPVYSRIKQTLSERLTTYLTTLQDPRALGNDAFFDTMVLPPRNPTAIKKLPEKRSQQSPESREVYDASGRIIRHETASEQSSTAGSKKHDVQKKQATGIHFTRSSRVDRR